MKKLLSKETEEKTFKQILQVLLKNKCTLNDYERISNKVHQHYKDNAIL